MKTCPECKMRYPDQAQSCLFDGADLVLLRDPRVGTTLVGRYLIEEIIGEGGMATVYRAKHKLVDRPCAIKIMNPILAIDDVVRERFRREAKNASKLAHPNIVEIFDQGDTGDGTAYIAMELLQGSSLAELVASGPLPVPRALGIMTQITRGIARAHDFDVVHRDLKPENVFVSPHPDGGDLAKILDFGVARSRLDTRLTNAGELFGTPQYMAPERIEGGETGPSADLYALGVMFWEMLTGRLPFDAADVATYFMKHLHEEPRSTRVLNADVPEALDALVLALLGKEPKARPVDAHRVHQDLHAIATAQHVLIPAEIAAEIAAEDDGGGAQRTARHAPSSREDPWRRRARAVEHLFARAYGRRAPAAAMAKLDEVKGIVARLERALETCAAEQEKLAQLDTRGHEGRSRFGSAVDALGVDASRERDEVRVSRAMAALAAEEVKQAEARYTCAHKEILVWEGRSAFQEPYADLAAAYRAAADAIDAWRTARDEERKALASCEVHQRALSDVEFQIRELRAGLSAFEQTLEGELAACEQATIAYNREVDELEGQALARLRRLLEPLEEMPELTEDLATLVKDLDGKAAE